MMSYMYDKVETVLKSQMIHVAHVWDPLWVWVELLAAVSKKVSFCISM